MTYVNEKLRVFLDQSSLKPLRRRSDGRLKRYGSTEDLRAWNYTVQDRREQILDLVRRDIEQCSGSLTEIIVLFFKNKCINDLKKCCKILWKFLNFIPLDSDTQQKLRCVEAQLGRFFKHVIDGCKCAGDVGLICPCERQKIICPCGQKDCDCEIKDQKQGVLSGYYTVKSAGPVRLTTKIRGIKPGLEMPSDSLAVKAQCSPCRSMKVVKNAYPEGNNVKTVNKSGTSSTEGRSTPSSLGVKSDTTNSDKKGEFNSKKRRYSANSHLVYSLFDSTSAAKRNDVFKNKEIDSLTEFENPIKKLQDALEERDCLCEKQQEHIVTLKFERDKLNSRICECLKELENLKKLNNNKQYQFISATSDRSDNEGQIIKEELDALKQYCLQLRETEEENEKLKRERDLLKRQLEMPSLSILPTFSREAINDEKLNEVTKERDSLKDKLKLIERQFKRSGSSPSDFEIYKDRSAMLDNTLAERDQMLRKLDDMNELQKELDVYKKKAERVDELEKSLRSLKYDKTSDYNLRKAKSECNCLEKELDNLKTEREALKRRIDFLIKEKDILRAKNKEAEVLKVERDKLQIKVNDLAHVQMHNENLRLKCKSLESASNEGYMYKQKYEELLVMECECKSWKSQVEVAEHVKRERDSLRKQVTDLQSVIVEQENEIKKLEMNAEILMKHKDETQMRMREALTHMRDEIEKKDSLIAASEEKLEKVQAELKSSIQGVSCETICYKTRLEELENELEYARKEIRNLENQFREKCTDGRISKSEFDSLGAMKKELDAAKTENKKLQEIAKKMVALTGDEHVQKMLKHSESAIRKVVAELSKQYKEWDHYKRERRRSRSRSYDRSAKCQQAETVKIGDLQVIRENDVLKKNNHAMPEPRLCPGELIALKLRNAQLLEKLQKSTYRNEKT